ncbi:hypothetical protein MLD52_19825 [Puniceicoccaceae bacterium K14]|nr:hypothetical protein [Puniceicoccaceae bacterium K14]
MKTRTLLALLCLALAGCTPHISTPIQPIKVVTLDSETKEPVPFAVVKLKKIKSTVFDGWTGSGTSSTVGERVVVTNEKGEITTRGFATLGLAGLNYHKGLGVSKYITFVDDAYSADSWNSGNGTREDNTFTVYLKKMELPISRFEKAKKDLYGSYEPVKKFRNRREIEFFRAIYTFDKETNRYRRNKEEYEALISKINKKSNKS